ncbi:MAG: ABC transporter ATP-binding protein [Alphaproteobacteria bacterium]
MTSEVSSQKLLNALEIKAMAAGYGNVRVFEDVHISVLRGEFFGLVGLNGVGKTTLIKSLVSLRDEISGDIFISGKNRTEQEAKRNIAYLPERFDPPWFLTGEEFLKFSLELYGQPFDQETVLEAVDKLALDRAALKRKMHTYSKGMRQKLGLLGTILTNCSILILDEPMSGLDPMARTQVKDMLTKHKREDQTIFLSSHILADMDEICDRIAILHAREIKFVGTPKELKRVTKTDNLERAFLKHIEQ